MSAIAFPDLSIVARRAAIVAGLATLLPAKCLVDSQDERRAFKTDGLTAYRHVPLAVVLPRSTAEVSAVVRHLHREGVKMVSRGAGTSLCSGAIPQPDAVVPGNGKLNRVLDIDFANRTARVESGVTNLAITGAVSHEGFFTRARPVVPAKAVAGQVGSSSPVKSPAETES